MLASSWLQSLKSWSLRQSRGGSLAEGTEFRELGPAHLDRQHKHRVTKGLVRRLDALGYQVILRPKLAA